MTVTAQLLAELVSAHENSRKLPELKHQLIKATSGVDAVAFRYHDYIITVETKGSPFGGGCSKHVKILQVQDLTPRPIPEGVVKAVLGAGPTTFAYHGDPNVAVKVPGNNNPRQRDVIVRALALLTESFDWEFSPQGRRFWVDLTNQLRAVLGQTPWKD